MAVTTALPPASAPRPARAPFTLPRGLLLGPIPIVALLLAWYLVAKLGIYSAVLLPAPGEVMDVFLKQPGELWKHTQASLARVSIGVGSAVVTAVPLGLLIGRYRTLDALSDWFIQMFRSFPPISLIPLAILFFGIGDRPAVILIWFAAFWPLVISTVFGVKNVERTLLKVARAAHAGDLLVLRDILLPGAMPSVLVGLRLAVGAGWLTVVTAEMMAVKSGLGYLIMYAQTVFRPDLVIAGILTIGVIGLALDQGLRLVRRYLCGWQDGLVLEA